MRYALYVAPPADHALTRAAVSWLGRDAFGGAAALQPPEGTGLDADFWKTITSDPRRYGFHATIKAPFRLAEGKTEAGLQSAVQAFAERTQRFEITLALAAIGPFFALIEDEPSAALARFAGDVVTEFEPFRAPLSEADYARRRPERLSPRERELLDQWGYPYVFDEFQFHMSLTGPVPVERQEDVYTALKRHFRAFVGEPISISHLALFEEPASGADFAVRAIHPLS